jgi:geranylgeranyl diphosphate synthase type II
MTLAHLEFFPESVRAGHRMIEERLERYTRFGADCPERLGAAIRYSLLAPGKRLRPLLVLAAAETCGGSIEAALPAACAVELIHTYSLIHDDLPSMDDDDLRRGQATCHIKFDEATAILAGDALIPLAFEILASDCQPAEVATRCVLELSRAAGALQLVGGQVDDLQSQFNPPDRQRLEHIHYRKTAAMLAVSLKLGAITAGAAESELNCLEKFGKQLGLAFQIADDLLDLRGDQVKMGKRARKDHHRGKMTYPAVIGVEASQKLASELIDAGCKYLLPFGLRSEPLRALARFVIERTI